LAWDKSTSYLCYCVGGIRYGSGVSLIQAFVWNLGTYMLWRLISPSYRDGVIRISDEVDESSWSEGITLISCQYGSTRLGRTPL
jgi:hypothetical protein